MWVGKFRGAALILVLSAAISHAQPVFTDDDRVIVRRNAALLALVDTDPGLVRRALDAIAAARAGTLGRSDVRGAKPMRHERPPSPARNPDLDQLGRSSPEAAHDLFVLIKRAGKSSDSNAPR